jgi:hypothetical protein
MSPQRMSLILSMMIAAGDVRALPARATWPIHQALIWLAAEASRRSIDLGLPIRSEPDPDVCVAAVGAEEAICLLLHGGLLATQGHGYAARWCVDAELTSTIRRALFRHDPATARLIHQAGQRLATAASTAMKNLDSATVSWTSAIAGSTPTVRQPRLVALR